MLVISVLFVGLNLFVDLLYAVLDPRVRTHETDACVPAVAVVALVLVALAVPLLRLPDPVQIRRRAAACVARLRPIRSARTSTAATCCPA